MRRGRPVVVAAEGDDAGLRSAVPLAKTNPSQVWSWAPSSKRHAAEVRRAAAVEGDAAARRGADGDRRGPRPANG